MPESLAESPMWCAHGDEHDDPQEDFSLLVEAGELADEPVLVVQVDEAVDQAYTLDPITVGGG
jgi:hypothetical protein